MIYTHAERMARAQARVLSVRAYAFGGYGIENIQCKVDLDGTVRVYDPIAGHYTTCHSLSPRAQARIRRLAKAKQA